METRSEELETINVWELMSGLNEDGSSPKSKQFAAISRAKDIVALPTHAAAKLSLDTFTLEAENERMKPPQQPSALKVINRRHAKSSVLALEHPVAHASTSALELNPDDISYSNGSSLFGSVSGSNTSPSESLADNLQRSLSFKVVFDSHNKGMLGLDDNDCGSNVLAERSSNRRSSEGECRPMTTSSNPLFSTSAKLRKWFKANKGALKLQNAIRGGSKQERAPIKLTTHSKMVPTLNRGLSDNGIEGGSSHKCSESESGSSHRGSDEFPEPNSESLCMNAGLDQKRVAEIGQGGLVRRYRHSFSTGNQNRGSIEESSSAAMNRPSSWELEKVVVDSGAKAVLYTTNLRTDINAYEDSNAVRAILISLVGAAFDEKSVSQNPAFEQELKIALNLPVVAVPTICIRGKYIAGIDNIMQFFKKGILSALLLETLPHGLKPNAPCMCRGGKFLICPICRGKRKLTRQGEDPTSCRHCIGTGLLKCPNCPKQ